VFIIERFIVCARNTYSPLADVPVNSQILYKQAVSKLKPSYISLEDWRGWFLMNSVINVFVSVGIVARFFYQCSSILPVFELHLLHFQALFNSGSLNRILELKGGTI
jgi:hypothetical protein